MSSIKNFLGCAFWGSLVGILSMVSKSKKVSNVETEYIDKNIRPVENVPKKNNRLSNVPDEVIAKAIRTLLLKDE